MELAELGLTVDESGALRSLTNFEQAALRTAVKAETAAARSATAYSNWWERALRHQEREHERVQRALAQAEARAAREMQAHASAYARAQSEAAREAARAHRAAERERTAAARATEREVSAAAKQSAKEQAAAAVEAARAARTATKEREKAERDAARESARMAKMVGQERMRLHNEAMREERRAARESERMARDVQRAKERADREATRTAKQAIRERERAEEEAARRSQERWRFVRRAIFLATAGIGVREIVEFADAWKLLDARIRILTKTEEERAAVQNELFNVAQRSRSDLEATGMLYTRMAFSVKNLGATHADLLKVTEAVAKGYVSYGASQQEVIGSTRQFTQALASNRLAGDELRSVLENAPRLAQAIAEGMGITIGQLREFGREGKLTSEAVFNAIVKQADQINREFGQMPVTVGQSITMARNSLFRFIGIMDKATGATGALSRTIIWVSQNIPLLTSVVIALVTAWVSYNIAVNIAVVRTAILGAMQTIQGILSLIRAVRSLSDAMSLLSLVSKGAAGAIATIVAMGVGYAAYKKMQKEMAEATEESNAELLNQMVGAKGLTGEVEKLTKEERNRLIENQKMVAAARQAIELAKLEGMAQEQLRIDYEAANKVIEARGKFKGEILGATLRAIEEERVLRHLELQTRTSYEQLKLRTDTLRVSEQAAQMTLVEGAAQTRLRIETEATNKAIEARRTLIGDLLDYALTTIDMERRNRLIEASNQIMQQFRSTVEQTMSGLFEGIFERGIKSFGDLFSNIRSMYFRMLADMMARRFMEGIGQRIAGTLGRMFGDLDKLRDPSHPAHRGALAPLALSNSATALSGSATALTSSATALNTAAANLSRASGQPTPGVTPDQTEATPIEIVGITATARRSWLADMAKYLGPAISGFMMGMSVGGMTTNRGLGALGGGLSGAATGTMIGSAIPGVGTLAGAIVGGITGAIGGLVGSSRRRTEEERARNEILQRNNEVIARLNENFRGALLSGQNLAKALNAVNLGISGGVGEASFWNRGGASRMAGLAKEFGLTAHQLEMIIADLGITLYDSAGKIIPGALKQLREALELTIRSVTQFGGTFDEQQRRQEAFNRLWELPETPKQELSDAFEMLTKMSPDLVRMLGLTNLNLDTEAGRNVLAEGLREIFRMIDAGMLTPELLGAFTDKNQLLDAILAVRDGLNQFKQQLDDVVTDFPKATSILLYERMYGQGTGGTSGGPPVPPTGGARLHPSNSVGIGTQIGVNISGPVTIRVVNEAGDDEEVLVRKIQSAFRNHASRGGQIDLPGVFVEVP